MKVVSVIRHHQVSFLMQSHPSHVLVTIVFDKVELLLEGVYKDYPSGFFVEWCRFYL
jgi:hypothetical protein